MKICSVCRMSKPLTDFHKANTRKGEGRQRLCKLCAHAATKRWIEKHPEARKKAVRTNYLKRLYGITPQQYEEMLEDQDFECLICHVDIDDYPKEFAIDHDHATGKIRGLLCLECNLILGNAKDNIETLLSAIKYLKEANSTTRCN